MWPVYSLKKASDKDIIYIVEVSTTGQGLAEGSTPPTRWLLALPASNEINTSGVNR